jgi:hypothetical protein
LITKNNKEELTVMIARYLLKSGSFLISFSVLAFFFSADPAMSDTFEYSVNGEFKSSIYLVVDEPIDNRPAEPEVEKKLYACSVWCTCSSQGDIGEPFISSFSYCGYEENAADASHGHCDETCKEGNWRYGSASVPRGDFGAFCVASNETCGQEAPETEKPKQLKTPQTFQLEFEPSDVILNYEDFE